MGSGHCPSHRIEVGFCRKQEVGRTDESLTNQVSDGLRVKPATLEGLVHGRVRYREDVRMISRLQNDRRVSNFE